MELRPLHRNGHDGAAASPDRVRAQNGNGVAHNASTSGETKGLLPAGCNGQSRPSGQIVEVEMEAACTQREINPVSQIRGELNEFVFWKVKLWMIIVFIFFFFAFGLGLALYLSTVIYDDKDEKFDAAMFQVPLFANGTFQLTNQIFTEELLSPSSNQSRALASELQEKLADLYRSSPALGRYFSTAEIYGFRNGSVIAEYRLRFLMPVEHKELLKFTLSREMVFNVFRQFLYDQETDDAGPEYIDPLSLNMFYG
ncbi:TPA-induced transmembrane protein homolog [Genypterus blacodes]|uniref:TPA-induced transmembrane protein homolog n=1 Tax=Genypterus blacodes TaxID=154954 RepID=UPI003F759333